jgi:hypothetical protein
MFSTLRKRISTKRPEPFGKAGLTVAVIALVMALVGGAYAAGGLTKSQEKQVTKIAKKYAGKPGAAGPAGPVGAAGTNGSNGAAGKNGTNGKSVVVGSATTGPSGECEEGGATVEVEGTSSTKKHVCNGSPWVAGGTLPSGQTETGVWAPRSNNPGELESFNIPISFTLPLSAALEDEEENGEAACGESEASRTLKCQVHCILSNGKEFLRLNGAGNLEAEQSVCLGSVAEPTAKPGNLCVYTSPIFLHVQFLGFRKLSNPGAHGADTAGSKLELLGGTEAPRLVAGGTWAVTAP